MTDDRIRLQKYLSMCAVASRRKAEELIAQGKVKVNGKVAQIGDKVSPKHDTVTVGGRKIVGNKKHYYIMLHKPRGYITTMDDEMGRKCVAELVRDVGARVYPVGRLDKDSEGLLLMTNQGDIVNKILRGGNAHEKEYAVAVNHPVTEEFLNQMCEGVRIEDLDVTTKPCRAWKTGSHTFHIVLTQGLNRQIRRMCRALDYHVMNLKRVRIMNLQLGTLKREIGRAHV